MSATMDNRADAGAQNAEWVDVCGLDDLEEGSCSRVTVGTRQMTALRLGDNVHLLPATCPHRGAPLYESKLIRTLTADAPGGMEIEAEQPVLMCPWHRWQFDPETGKTVFESNIRLKRVETRIDNGRVLAKARVKGTAAAEAAEG